MSNEIVGGSNYYVSSGTNITTNSCAYTYEPFKRELNITLKRVTPTSTKFLKRTNELMLLLEKAGWEIENLDITIEKK